MKEEYFQALSQQLQDHKADKFHTLLILYRNNVLKEDEIAKKLSVNANTYYTLKSRLYNKVQETLTTESGSKFNLLQNVTNIPNLLFNSNRDIALAILAKLEKDLIEYDMPYELTNVYNALKKLHIHSPKYYEYTQLYNKHIAYMLALDKAEDLLANYNKIYGEYTLSKDKSLLELLWLIKKEMTNLWKLYESHHLAVYKNIIDISVALFIPLPEATDDDKPVEDILTATGIILKSYPKDTTYQHLNILFDFLSFEYYHKLKLYKKEAQYFEKVNEFLPSFMLYNFCCFNSAFLLSKMERYVYLNKEETLYEENKDLITKYQPDKSDVSNYVNYIKYLAMGAFYVQKYSESISLLNGLLNEIYLKNITHAEIEIKLLLALSYAMTNEYKIEKSVLRSVSRKIREINTDMDYENATVFIKMLNLQMDASSKAKEEKLLQLKNRFELINQGNCRILSYLKLSDDFIRMFAKEVKQNA